MEVYEKQILIKGKSVSILIVFEFTIDFRGNLLDIYKEHINEEYSNATVISL